MAANANLVSLLLLGFFLFGTEYFSAVVARPPTQAQLGPGQNVTLTKQIDYEATLGTDAPTQPSENKENDSPILQARGFTISNSGFTISDSGFTNGGSGGGRVSIGNMGGMTIRAHNPNKPLGLNINNNKLTVGGKVISGDIRNRLAQPTYQKSADGTYWYTNLKVGEPMTQTEIENFETEWAEHERVREAERKKRDEEREKERREREAERERERVEREAERKKREEERERERMEREEERERERRERERERGEREEQRERERKEREAERKEREEQREREREEREAQRKQRDEEREKERRVRDEEREKARKDYGRNTTGSRRARRGRAVERPSRQVSSGTGRRRSNAGVNMTDPFRSDFMVGFDPFATDK